MTIIAPVDVTIPVQKLLCCIIRTNERFGTNYVIDVLLGSRSKRIVENGHNMISTWGIGNELSKEDWLELVDLLILEKYLVKVGEYNILTITSKGRDLLVTRENVSLPIRVTGGKSKSGMAFPKNGSADKPQFIVHKKANGSKIVALEPEAGDEAGEKLVTLLKAWRKRKAEDMNVPPYVIFGDKTILDLAAKKPKTKKELMNVYGIGEAKAEQFGKSILCIITEL